MVNLFQVLLAVCHKLIQQILYTQWNRIISHFYRLILAMANKIQFTNIVWNNLINHNILIITKASQWSNLRIA